MYESILAYYLKLVPHLTNDELDALTDRLTIRHVPKGGYLVKTGQVCRHVFFLNKGIARMFYPVDGKDISIGFFQAGDYGAEYESFLTRAPAAQSIDALTDVEVIDLGIDDMQELYAKYASFQEFGRKMAESLFIYLNQRNTALLSLSPEDRYRHMIAAQPALLQQVPQYMLASFIGVTPEHLSRIRKKMSR